MTRTAPIEMTNGAFREAGHDLVNQIADWLDALPQGPVVRDESPADIGSGGSNDGAAGEGCMRGSYRSPDGVRQRGAQPGSPQR